MLSSICPSCNKQNFPELDKDSGKVYCSVCSAQITANHFLLIQLKTLKQYRTKTPQAFAVKCNNCSNDTLPIIKSDKLYCTSCNKEITNISKPYMLMLKQHLSSKNEEI